MDIVRCAIKRCIVRFMHMKVVEIKIWFVVIDVCYVVTKWRVDVRLWMFFGVNVVKEFKEQGEDAHSPTEIGSLTISGLTTCAGAVTTPSAPLGCYHRLVRLVFI